MKKALSKKPNPTVESEQLPPNNSVITQWADVINLGRADGIIQLRFGAKIPNGGSVESARIIVNDLMAKKLVEALTKLIETPGTPAPPLKKSRPKR